MQPFPFRKIANVLAAQLLGTATMFAPVSASFATTPPTAREAAAPSEFEKEQAMSPAALIDRWTPLIKEASDRFGVSEAWIRAVMRTESGGRTLLGDKRPITSDAGAMGIMQLMPDTYREMRQLHGLGADPYDPRDNVLAGTAYLRWLRDRYGYPRLFVAYNAGPGTLEAQMAGARKLPEETRAYISSIARILGAEIPASQSAPNPPQPIKLIATLTRPDGSSITVDGDTVDRIRASFPNEFVPGVRTVVVMGERQQGVTEDVATVSALLGDRGGKL